MKKFDHAAFQVSDLTQAIKWYCDKLGFEFLFKGINEEEQEAYCFLKYGNSRLELIQDLVIPYQIPEVKKPFCPHVCLNITNMKAALEVLSVNNIPIVRGPLEIKDEETWVYFTDPDNNVLEFIEWYNKEK